MQGVVLANSTSSMLSKKPSSVDLRFLAWKVCCVEVSCWRLLWTVQMLLILNVFDAFSGISLHRLFLPMLSAMPELCARTRGALTRSLKNIGTVLRGRVRGQKWSDVFLDAVPACVVLAHVYETLK